MTVQEAILSITLYPCPSNTITKVLLDRGITSSDTYTKAIGEKDAFRLSCADLLIFISENPSTIREMDSSIVLSDSILENIRNKANKIYSELEPDSLDANDVWGFIGTKI